jgi:YVTN family beta-propeller protein
VAVDRTTNTVYVTNYGSNTMSVIDGTSNTVTATVADCCRPNGVAVDENTGTIYTANCDKGCPPTVAVIITSTVTVSPTSGPAATAVTVSGRGFNPGETIKITYKTGLASPKQVTICTTTAASDTSYTCSGTIPLAATAGTNGAHKILAKGLTSGIKVHTTYTLT